MFKAGDRVTWLNRQGQRFTGTVVAVVPPDTHPLAMWTVAERGALSFSQVEAQQVQDLALRMLAIVGRRYIDSRPALAELNRLKIPGLA